MKARTFYLTDILLRHHWSFSPGVRINSLCEQW